jgi:hypothetical protein
MSMSVRCGGLRKRGSLANASARWLPSTEWAFVEAETRMSDSESSRGLRGTEDKVTLSECFCSPRRPARWWFRHCEHRHILASIAHALCACYVHFSVALIRRSVFCCISGVLAKVKVPSVGGLGAAMTSCTSSSAYSMRAFGRSRGQSHHSLS